MLILWIFLALFHIFCDSCTCKNTLQGISLILKKHAKIIIKLIIIIIIIKNTPAGAADRRLKSTALCLW